MYSFVFCRVFIVLEDFRLHCVTTVTPFIRRRSVRRPQYFNSHKTLIACNAIPACSKVTFRLTEGKNVNYITPPLSSAEAPVSEHQRKKRERERWREKTGARGTML